MHAASKAAMATALGGAAMQTWFKATGVPLLEALQQLSTVQAAVRCAGLIAAAAAGVAVANKLLEIMGQKVGAGSGSIGGWTGCAVEEGRNGAS